MTIAGCLALRLAAAPALRDGLSAVVQIGPSLWLANDETTGLERLVLQVNPADGSVAYAQHVRFPLQNFLSLPVPPEAGAEDGDEIDIEGLAFSSQYLWLVGSHSLKRKKVKASKSASENSKRLQTVSRDDNRFLLARIPVNVATAIPGLERTLDLNGQSLQAAQLAPAPEGNVLMQALAADPHLQDFLVIPGKDNGFDIEGLAVVGERLLVGLRGPVLRGWAILLELETVLDAKDPTRLQLKPMEADGQLYRKHFLQLGGLGIRELCVQGNDLLIMAGPSMDLDGPVHIYRWEGGARPAEASVVKAEQLQHVIAVPYGQGDDHAEGMCLYQTVAGEVHLLLVYDSASPQRKQGDDTVLADLFTLS